MSLEVGGDILSPFTASSSGGQWGQNVIHLCWYGSGALRIGTLLCNTSVRVFGGKKWEIAWRGRLLMKVDPGGCSNAEICHSCTYIRVRLPQRVAQRYVCRRRSSGHNCSTVTSEDSSYKVWDSCSCYNVSANNLGFIFKMPTRVRGHRHNWRWKWFLQR